MSRIERAYGSMFGSEATKGKLYGGFYTLLFGVFGVLAGLALFIVSNGQEDRSSMFAWRESALVVASLSAPLIFFGIQLTLPSKKSLRNLSILGILVAFFSVVLFSVFYPTSINVADSGIEEQAKGDKTSLVAGTYIVGLGLILVGTFTSLIGYYVDRIQAVSGAAQQAGADGGAFDPNYDVPDSVIEKDIEYAMRKYKYAWGEGEGGGSNAVQINIADSFAPGVVVGGGKGVARTVQLETPQVDDATTALRNIRPSKDKTMSSEWTDEQTNALLAFRKQKAEMPQKFAPGGMKLGWWARFMIWLGFRKDPAQKAGK